MSATAATSRTAAILPIKRFGAAKTRLGELLGPAARATLAEAMLSDVLAALLEVKRLDLVLVVSGEPRAAAVVAAVADERLRLIDDPGDRGHSEAALLGVAVAVAEGCDAVALLPGDCPLLEPAELDAALSKLEPGVAAVIPDRHGSGTNGLLLSPPEAIEPAFGPGSRERHLGLARAAGVTPRVAELPSLALDLDTPADLEALRAAVAARPGRSPATAAALASIPGTTAAPAGEASMRDAARR